MPTDHSRSPEPCHSSRRSSSNTRYEQKRSHSPRHSRTYGSDSGRRRSSSTRYEQKRSHSPRHSRTHGSDFNAVGLRRNRSPFNHNQEYKSEPPTKMQKKTDAEDRTTKKKHNSKQSKDKIAEETSDPVHEERAAVFQRSSTTFQNGHELVNDRTPDEVLELDSDVSFSGGKTPTHVKPQTESGYDCTCVPNTIRKASIGIEEQLSDKGFRFRLSDSSTKSLGGKLTHVFASNRWEGTKKDEEVCWMFVNVRNSITHSREHERSVKLWHIQVLEKRVSEIIEKKVR